MEQSVKFTKQEFVIFFETVFSFEKNVSGGANLNLSPNLRDTKKAQFE